MINKIVKKALAVGTIAVLGLGVLSGCIGPSQEDIQAQINDAVMQATNDALESIDVTADNAAAVAQATESANAENARLQAVIDDMKQAAEEIAVEDEEQNVTTSTETSFSGYDIDDVTLNGNFESTVDNDDLDKLYYVDIDDYESEDYIVEEKLYLTSDIAPVLNMDDLNGEVVVEVGSKGSITYMVEFDTGIEFDADSDDTLDIKFLGNTMRIADYDGDEVTFRLSQSYYLEKGNSVTVDGKVITLKGVNEDGDKIYVEVDGVSKSIREGRKEKINGIEIYANDIFGGDTLSMAELYIGDSVEESVGDGDEYELDDDYEWVITESGNELTGIGIRYDVKLVDDDEVLKLGDSIVLPNEYLKVSFSEIKDMEGMDLSLDLNNDDIDLEFDGKIEVDGDRVDSATLTLYINDEGDAAYDYKYKSDKYENNTDFTDIVIFNDDRELSVEFNSTQISVNDANVDYVLDYVFGDEFSSVAGTITEEVNDDDDYRVDNGDLMYASDLNEGGEEEDSFVVALKNDEEIELVMRVE